jgi:predicted aspartyl protease
MPKKDAFTIEYPDISNTLITRCRICEAFDPRARSIHPTMTEVDALWDTGATGTVISKNLAEKLQLKPQGQQKSRNTKGEYITNVYYINIMLPNSVGFAALRVTEGDMPDFDVLIGMDIIMQGDFAISQSDRKTKFTFQIPSTHDFDFYKENYLEAHTPVIAPKTPGRNDPCSCGSGKKFKQCCGK